MLTRQAWKIAIGYGFASFVGSTISMTLANSTTMPCVILGSWSGIIAYYVALTRFT